VKTEKTRIFRFWQGPQKCENRRILDLVFGDLGRKSSIFDHFWRFWRVENRVQKSVSAKWKTKNMAEFTHTRRFFINFILGVEKTTILDPSHPYCAGPLKSSKVKKPVFWCFFEGRRLFFWPWNFFSKFKISILKTRPPRKTENHFSRNCFSLFSNFEKRVIFHCFENAKNDPA